MRRMRSTSPPKSACPGVSTMLILVSRPAHRQVLGQDGDAPLALQRVGVHHPLLHLLVLAEGARLAQHVVDQRRLAVVDVGDDGDIANRHGSRVFSWRKQKTRALHRGSPRSRGAVNNNATIDTCEEVRPSPAHRAPVAPLHATANLPHHNHPRRTTTTPPVPCNHPVNRKNPASPPNGYGFRLSPE